MNVHTHGHLREGESIHQFGRTIDHLGMPFIPVHLQGALGVSLDNLHFMFSLEFPQCILEWPGIHMLVEQGYFSR